MTDEELNQLIAQTEDTAMQARLREILRMPPEQREQAIAQLTQAYDPLREDLRGDLERNFALATQQGPQGQVAGNNQFSVYVGASPLEHLASGVTKYQAGKAFKEGRQELKDLSGQESDAQKRMLQSYTASILRDKDSSLVPRKFYEDEDLPFWMRHY